jgi:hypothetical protein
MKEDDGLNNDGVLKECDFDTRCKFVRMLLNLYSYKLRISLILKMFTL